MTTPTTGSRVLITIFIIAGMLITGTANTLLNKWQNRVCVKNCIDGGASGGSGASRVYYEQPVVQSLTMFVGELLCLLVYYGMQAVSSWSGGARKPHGVEDEEKAPLLAGASGSGQTDAGSASTSTIARRGGAADAIADEQCSIESLVDMEDDDDTAIDDKTRLLREKNGGMGRDTPTIDVVDADKQPVPMQGWAHLYLWLPALCDIIGSTLMNVGLLVVFASVYQMLRGSVVIFTGIISYFWLKRTLSATRIFALCAVLIGIGLVGASPVLLRSGAADSGSDDESSEPQSTIVPQEVGVALIIGAQIFSALQFVIEEKIMMEFSVSPMKLVGFQGLFGLTTLLFTMPVLYLTVGKDSGSMLDIAAAFDQIGSNPVLWGSTIAFVFCIGAFNYFGLNITRYISATARTTIDTSRTLFIWLISLYLGWETFIWLEVVGFLVLIYGTFLFNGLIPACPAFVTRAMSRRRPAGSVMVV